MILRVDPSSALPPYDQIRGQLATMIATGVLPAGQRLPTIRQLATDLGIARGTVARAFRELEHGGFITSRGRHGTFISHQVPAGRLDRERVLLEAASVFATQAAQAGADPRRVLERALEALHVPAGPDRSPQPQNAPSADSEEAATEISAGGVPRSPRDASRV
jgi:GntR family transcriptional regulator